MLYLQGKKKIKTACFLLLNILFTCTYHSVSAQKVLYQTDHDAKSYYFGITLGGNFARFHMEPHSRFTMYDSVLVTEPLKAGGFALGLSATTKLSNRFEARINPQLIFTERSIFYQLKYADPLDGIAVTKRIESILFAFPFQIKFNSDRIGNFRVYMMAGAKLEMDLAANARARRAEDLVKLEKSDYGLELGMGFNFYFESFILSPEIKISNGIRNIHARDEALKYSNVIDRIQSRMIVFSIHLEG